ncbi:hypothetical protein MJC1_04177 [Methylocystis sp. MJC1]|nr:hypothetical protein MJC1_04177 [Methylocystis sp. MJC1]
MRDKYGGAEHRRLTRVANERSRQAAFNRVRALHKEGRNVMDIARQTGFDRRTVAKWIRAEALPERSTAAPKTTSPRHFEDFLSRRWSEGCVRGRHLFQKSTCAVTQAVFQTSSGFCEMVQSEMQDGEGNIGCSESATCRSRNWTFNLADCGCGALHQVAWIVDRQSSCKSRCDGKGLARVRDDASTRHAL